MHVAESNKIDLLTFNKFSKIKTYAHSLIQPFQSYNLFLWHYYLNLLMCTSVNKLWYSRRQLLSRMRCKIRNSAHVAKPNINSRLYEVELPNYVSYKESLFSKTIIAQQAPVQRMPLNQNAPSGAGQFWTALERNVRFAKVWYTTTRHNTTA